MGENNQVTFEPERATKNTVKFNEVVRGDASIKIGALYVQKNTLKEIGWTEGKWLTVTLEVEA